MRKKNIFGTLKRNHQYILHYANILLKTRVAGSYLGFLWLYLDPLMFMLIYSFVVQVLFRASSENFNVFVLIGITAWNLMSRTILMGATAVVRNKSIFQQVYFHKSVYPTIYLLSYFYEFLIAMSLVFIMMLVQHVHFTLHILEVIPVIIVMLLFTYGITLIVSHIGVYFFDLRNILDFTLRFLFYMSPILWSFDWIGDAPYVTLLKLNPLAIIFDALRNSLMYGESPSYFGLMVLAVFSIILIQIGYWLISRHEDEYARMI
jgi:ABC-type polysaccharide/polyol phosphate export permease